MSELKPCPFCGESKLLYSGGCGFRYDDDDNQIRLFRVHCRTCKGRTGLFESLDEAVEAWNRRTNSTTIQPSEHGTNLASLGTDVISRKALINELEQWQKQDGYDNGEWNLLVDVITEIKNMPLATDIYVGANDAISRQVAIDGINEYMVGKRCDTDGTMMARLVIDKVIKQLPPIQPKRGRWESVPLKRARICSCCGHDEPYKFADDDTPIYNFCPHCGADMRGEQDG